MTPLQRAREKVAAAYPETLTDSMGREHRCIPREAILAGLWDQGALVRGALDVVGGEGA